MKQFKKIFNNTAVLILILCLTNVEGFLDLSRTCSKDAERVQKPHKPDSSIENLPNSNTRNLFRIDLRDSLNARKNYDVKTSRNLLEFENRNNRNIEHLRENILNLQREINNNNNRLLSVRDGLFSNGRNLKRGDSTRNINRNIVINSRRFRQTEERDLNRNSNRLRDLQRTRINEQREDPLRNNKMSELEFRDRRETVEFPRTLRDSYESRRRQHFRNRREPLLERRQRDVIPTLRDSRIESRARQQTRLELDTINRLERRESQSRRQLERVDPEEKRQIRERDTRLKRNVIPQTTEELRQRREENSRNNRENSLRKRDISRRVREDLPEEVSCDNSDEQRRIRGQRNIRENLRERRSVDTVIQRQTTEDQRQRREEFSRRVRDDNTRQERDTPRRVSGDLSERVSREREDARLIREVSRDNSEEQRRIREQRNIRENLRERRSDDERQTTEDQRQRREELSRRVRDDITRQERDTPRRVREDLSERVSRVGEDARLIREASRDTSEEQQRIRDQRNIRENLRERRSDDERQTTEDQRQRRERFSRRVLDDNNRQGTSRRVREDLSERVSREREDSRFIREVSLDNLQVREHRRIREHRNIRENLRERRSDETVMQRRTTEDQRQRREEFSRRVRDDNTRQERDTPRRVREGLSEREDARLIRELSRDSSQEHRGIRDQRNIRETLRERSSDETRMQQETRRVRTNFLEEQRDSNERENFDRREKSLGEREISRRIRLDAQDRDVRDDSRQIRNDRRSIEIRDRVSDSERRETRENRQRFARIVESVVRLDSRRIAPDRAIDSVISQLDNVAEKRSIRIRDLTDNINLDRRSFNDRLSKAKSDSTFRIDASRFSMGPAVRSNNNDDDRLRIRLYEKNERTLDNNGRVFSDLQNSKLIHESTLDNNNNNGLNNLIKLILTAFLLSQVIINTSKSKSYDCFSKLPTFMGLGGKQKVH